MIQNVYKVVKTVKDVDPDTKKPEIMFFSSIAPPPLRTRYKVGERSFPHQFTGGLYAFKDRASANRFLKFMDRDLDMAILLCDARVVQRHNVRMWPMVSNIKVVLRFWDSAYEGDSAPHGTVLCSWIEPIRLA